MAANPPSSCPCADPTCSGASKSTPRRGGPLAAERPEAAKRDEDGDGSGTELGKGGVILSRPVVARSPLEGLGRGGWHRAGAGWLLWPRSRTDGRLGRG